MALTLKPLSRQVIVITGASSGIGLATAIAAARQGARLVLAARNDQALTDIESKINESGGEAMHIAADVSREEEVRHVAEAAIRRFGGFDTWINNAGVSIWGRLRHVSDEDSRRLFDTNFWGVVYGSLVAVEHLRKRGGALINIGSVASDLALPIQGMYSASKHAVKGFTDALRMEIEEEGAPISVTLIKPASINTPFPQHARNYTDHEPRLPDPCYEPEEVAHAILYAAAHPQRDIYVGGSGRAMVALQTHAPRAMDLLGERFLIHQELREEPPRNPEGSLHHAGDDGHVHGDHPTMVLKKSLYTRATLNPLMTGTILAAAGLAALRFFSGRRA